MENIVDTSSALSGWIDYLVIIVIAVLALFYLYKKIWKNKNRCASCSLKGNCSTQYKKDIPVTLNDDKEKK